MSGVIQYNLPSSWVRYDKSVITDRLIEAKASVQPLRSMPFQRRWVQQAERDKGSRQDGLSTTERKELAQLRRENRRLRMEREILVKADAWFAWETDSIP